jgi:hypothetical protein
MVYAIVIDVPPRRLLFLLRLSPEEGAISQDPHFRVMPSPKLSCMRLVLLYRDPEDVFLLAVVDHSDAASLAVGRMKPQVLLEFGVAHLTKRSSKMKTSL